MLLNHRLLILSFNANLDVTKQLKLFRKDILILNQGWFKSQTVISDI